MFIFTLYYFFILINLLLASTVKPNPKIVIIGSGPSGIACATSLKNYGFEDITILEAEPRIGGRINTIPFGDNVIDLGAQWCHGEKNNVVYEYVKDLNLLEPTEEIATNFTLIRSNGENITIDINNRLKMIVDGIKERFFAYNNYSGNANDFISREYMKILQEPQNNDIDFEIANEVLVIVKKDIITYNGAEDLTGIPAHGDIEYEECEGEYLLNWKDKGYKELLRLLMKTDTLNKEYGILDGHIKLSKSVETIYWQRDDGKILIKLSDGEEMLVDHVIVTVSLGVLKAQHDTLFEPKLPIEKQHAIQAYDFGTVDKIVLEFPERFWPEHWQGIGMLWRNEELSKIRGTEKAWYEGVFGFSGVNYQPRVLIVWIVGSEARHMETLSDEDIKDACMYMFKTFLPWKTAIPEPIKIIKTTWGTNPHFRGSYSAHTIKAEEMNANRRHLINPLYKIEVHNCDTEENCHFKKPLVQFAGEATSIKHYASVHGAVESGWREAERLADFYGLIKTKFT